MISADSNFFAAVMTWLNADPAVNSAVLFGSAATLTTDHVRQDDWSDIDLHIVTCQPAKLCRLDWVRALPTQRFCLHAWQKATGVTNKATVIFAAGQIDIVVVSRTQMRLARWAMRVGLHRRCGFIRDALNEMATSMRTGYRFLKGADEWNDVYERVVKEMTGVRLQDSAVHELAAVFLVNLLLALKRLKRGELVAAQYTLHRHLTETNLRLLRELRLRQGLPLPSFGLGRRVEVLLSPLELSWVQVSATLQRDELLNALTSVFDGMRTLTSQLVPGWNVPAGFDDLLAPYSAHFTRLARDSRLRTE